MENIIKGNAVDFERVTSLDGTFIANRYDDGHTHDPVFNKSFRGKDFTEEDMIAEEERKNSKSRMSNSGASTKQAEKTLKPTLHTTKVPAGNCSEHRQ
jgi:hypothetical protein